MLLLLLVTGNILVLVGCVFSTAISVFLSVGDILAYVFIL